MKPYFRFPKCILLIWRELRTVAYLLVIFCPRGILMEIESFFSNSLPFTLQNDFSTCLILSFHTIFRGFNISVNNLVQTRPQASTTPAAHTRDNTIMQNFCTFEIGNSDLFPRKHHLHFFHSLTTRVSMSNAFWLLEAFSSTPFPKY